MEQLGKLQDNCKEIIARGQVNYNKTPKDRIKISYIESRLETLETQWQNFTDTHKQIIAEVDNADLISSSYHKSDIYDETEELYINYKSQLKEVLLKLTNTGSSSSAKSNDVSEVNQKVTKSVAKLSNIPIPTFSGKYTEWPGFRDLFVALVHSNESLDDVCKLHYLKSHLSGEAEQLLRHIAITGNNYVICWTQLQNRYDNKKFLANHILQRLMSQRSLQSESSSSLKELLDNMNECLSALQNLGINTSSWDILVIYIMSQRLDPESRKQWESKANESEDLPTLDNFKGFLEHKFRSLEFLDSKSKPKTNTASSSKVFHVVNPSVDASTGLNCPFCKASHKLANCKEFAKEEIDARRNFIQTNRLCFNCLGRSHTVYSCRQSTRCRICKRKHNSLLHPKTISQSTDKGVSVDDSVAVSTATTSQKEVNNVITGFSTMRSQVLLATALVEVESRIGAGTTLRCLLDQGSQASFITESAVQALGLQKVSNKISISGVGSDQGDSLVSKSVVYLKLKSLHDPTYVVEVKAHVLKRLTTFLPPKKVVIQPWSALTNFKLADPKFEIPNKIDLLLGAEVLGQILVEGLVKGPQGSPVAQNTKFGWVVSGQIYSESETSDKCQSNTIISMHTQVDENDILKKFWELESENSCDRKKLLSQEEEKCEEIFNTTTTRDESGRYIVELPFRDDDPKCKYGKSRDVAVKRFHQLENRFKKNAELKAKYSEVFKEYLSLGHMQRVEIGNDVKASEAVYLPHHAVIREDKTTTKLRMVFDASSKGLNGVSLNDTLLVGPTLQPELRHIIMRWRLHPICLCADIVKMYRQVKVAEDHVDFQRVVWRDNPEAEIEDYRLLRVTFGTASAPYLAVKTLQQLAHDDGESCPSVSEKVKNDFYVDDLMTGCQTVEEGVKIHKEMKKLLTKGGFELQKWVSNNKELLEEISEEGKDPERKVEAKLENVIKILGLSWDRESDTFKYSVQLPPQEAPITKRKVISDISRLFDPLGWAAPCVVTAKMFIQKLWLSGIDWDEELSPDLLKEWITYRNELSQLTSFCIPRWIHTNEDDACVELHGFSDASNDAYAAVVYVRVTDSNGEVHVNLITSKTKVSPIKQVSIPRLELCGAQLLAKLLLEVSEILKIPKDRVHAWTDSSVVLAWLSSHPSRWKTFVANRVSEILTVLDRSQWSHVRSKENPADCASRGVKASECAELKLWKEGPTWLRDEIINYSPQIDGNQDTNLEEKTKKVTCATTCVEEDELFTRFSSLRKLIRVVSFCRRFHQLTRSPIKPDFPVWLTSKELQEAMNICITQCQSRHLKDEIDSLIKSGNVSKKHHLKRVIGKTTLTFEEITTLLAQFEACLNSRPLSQLSDNIDVAHPLTPGQFLVGEPLLLDPDANYSLRRWQLTQRMLQDFWRRWSQEYLTRFLHRYKWNQQTIEPKIGDVVLVKEDDLPPARWLSGIIVDKHQGLDQVTRVVSLRCKGAIIKRPVSKLCVLPVTE